MKQETKPRQILLSKRANIFYLDRVRILQKDERLVYLSETGTEIQQYFNVPERNTALLLLGKGSSITDSAARKLAESNVMVGFCGSGGTPLFSTIDYVFLNPHSEYGPTAYMQKWAEKWFTESSRIHMARQLITRRIEFCEKCWKKDAALLVKSIILDDSVKTKFTQRTQAASTSEDILLAEAQWAKSLYAILARGYDMSFTREPGQGKGSTEAERINGYLDHGNYLAYGLAAVALNGLGISFAFPLLHGKTRRGALVFDVADLIKDALVMPLAFEMGKNAKKKERDFRAALIESFNTHHALDFLFEVVKDIALDNSAPHSTK